MRDDKDHRYLIEHIVFLRNYCAFIDPSGLHDHAFNFRCGDVLTAHFEHIFGSITEEEVPFVIEANEITGIKPTLFIECRIIRLMVAVIFLKQRNPAYPTNKK